MRSPGWYALATALAVTVVVFAAHVVFVYIGRFHFMQLPMIVAAFASTAIWAGYVTRGVGERWGRGVHALAALALAVGGGVAGFVVMYATGYVGLVLVLAAYAAPLIGTGHATGDQAI